MWGGYRTEHSVIMLTIILVLTIILAVEVPVVKAACRFKPGAKKQETLGIGCVLLMLLLQCLLLCAVAARYTCCNSWKRPFWGPGWPGLDFHRFSIKFLLETDHFGALAGRGSIFIDFLLNSY